MLPDAGTGYRFGSFEVKARTGLLFYKGRRVKVERLPLQILLALLETPGKVVSRDELCTLLWSDQNFLQANKGLQVAVAKLREALGEQASEPRFIKTVHRVGYQFIGDVAPFTEPTSTPATATASITVTDHPGQDSSLRQPEKWSAPADFAAMALQRAHIWRSLLLTAAGLAILAIALGLYFHFSREPLASAGEQIALGSVTNLTGDPGLTGTLSTAMRLEFHESPYIGVIPEQIFLQQIKHMGGADTLQARLSACSNLNAHLLIDGKIKTSSAEYPEAQSPTYEIVLNVWQCGSRRNLASESDYVSSKSSILTALDLVIDRLRKRLGESDASIERFHTPEAQITTASLAALKAFDLGEEKQLQGLELESVSNFRLAIDLDPQFALAYARLGTAYYNMHQRSLSQQYSRRAFELREHTSERERLYIASHYYSFVTGEIPQSIRAYELWMTLYPHDPAPATDLANDYLLLGYPLKALGPARQAVREEENHSDKPVQSVLMLSLLETGQYSTLNRLCQNPARWKSDSTAFHSTCLRLAGIENNAPEIQRELDWANANPRTIDVIEFAALIAEDKGRLSQGRALFSKGREIAHNDLLPNYAAELDLDQADIEVNLGLSTEARSHALDAMKLAPDEPYIQAFAAFALARAGDIAEAQAQAEKAAAEAPLDTILNDAVLPSVYAAIEMNRHDPKSAVSLLEKTRPLDGNMFMELAPAYYRGLAFMAAKQIGAAIREFRWVIAHRPLCPESIYVNLSLLQLGHSLQMSGRCDDARRAYAELHLVWKNADPDFPPLKDLPSFEGRCMTDNSKNKQF